MCLELDFIAEDSKHRTECVVSTCFLIKRMHIQCIPGQISFINCHGYEALQQSMQGDERGSRNMPSVSPCDIYKA